VLRHRVTVITLCPLGEPEIAIGQEPRIEPWLPRNRIACQVSRIDGRAPLENEPRERKSNPEKNLSSDRGPSANSGLDIETKNFSGTGRGRNFFVDIPFYRTPYLTLRYVVRSGFPNTYQLTASQLGGQGQLPHSSKISESRRVSGGGMLGCQISRSSRPVVSACSKNARNQLTRGCMVCCFEQSSLPLSQYGCHRLLLAEFREPVRERGWLP
jgi:hypothetical protein